jgi:hypothetical protein
LEVFLLKKGLKTVRFVRRSVIFFGLFFFISVPQIYGGDSGRDGIKVVLPGPALSKLFSELLPVRINPEGRVSGELLIQSVRNLGFDKDKVLCSIRFVGKQAKYTVPLRETTSVVIDVGNLDVSFDLEATLRFDLGDHRLYVKPTIVGDIQGVAEDSPLRLLLSLLTDMEYPIHVQKLVPVMTGVEGRPVQLELSISDAFSEKDRLVLMVQPRVVKAEEK